MSPEDQPDSTLAPSHPHLSPAGRTLPANNYTQKARLKIAALIGGIILLIIISSITGLAAYQNHVHQVNAAATTTAIHTTATAIHVTATAEASATAQIYAHATATVQTYQDALSNNSRLAFFDPLSSKNEWSPYNTSATGGNCQFINGSYHVSQAQKKYFMECDTDSTFSNFAFEVRMTIIQGDCGGVTFRRNNHSTQEYHFQVCQNDRYELFKYTNNKGADAQLLRSSITSSINTGLNQPNIIAVVAKDSMLTLYINREPIEQIQDSSYTEGSIGLIAYPQSGNATDVAYSNARVWTF